MHHRGFASVGFGTHPPEFLFECRNLAIEDPGSLLEVALALGLLGHGAQVIDEHLEFTDPIQAGLLGVPLRAQTRQLLFLIGDLSADPGQSLLGCLVGFLRDSKFLHAQTIDLALKHIDLHR